MWEVVSRFADWCLQDTKNTYYLSLPPRETLLRVRVFSNRSQCQSRLGDKLPAIRVISVAQTAVRF